jgi:myo-inositol 2-dehydrogenase/D-chiro-inositol 1-dehydrogenase
MAAKAGKAIFCEKPIDLDIKKVNKCLNQIKNTKVPIQIGFNRRFDSSHAKAQQARVKKEIGELEMIVITSRDPEPPGIDYLKAAGGFFRDTTIHDFDLARFILGNDPVMQISAFGEALFDKNAKKQKDHDTAMFILKSKKGVLIHINNSRRAVYGYDQRVEVFGSKGMIISNNQTPSSVERYTNKSTSVKDPIHFFFIERYEQAYRDQFNEFVKCVTKKTKPKVTFEDGKNALIIANAAYESYKKGKVVNIKF